MPQSTIDPDWFSSEAQFLQLQDLCLTYGYPQSLIAEMHSQDSAKALIALIDGQICSLVNAHIGSGTQQHLAAVREGNGVTKVSEAALHLVLGTSMVEALNLEYILRNELVRPSKDEANNNRRYYSAKDLYRIAVIHALHTEFMHDKQGDTLVGLDNIMLKKTARSPRDITLFANRIRAAATLLRPDSPLIAFEQKQDAEA